MQISITKREGLLRSYFIPQLLISCCLKLWFVKAGIAVVFMIAMSPLGAIANPDAELIISRNQTASVWTGRDMLLWPCTGDCFALDPEKNTWRTVATHPRPGRILENALLRLPDGSILAVYWVARGKTALCFDRFRPDSGQWEPLGAIQREDFKDQDGKPYENLETTFDGKEVGYFPLEIIGMTALADGAIVFVASNHNEPEVRGFRVMPDGSIKSISRKNAPIESYGRDDTAIYSANGKVLYFGYTNITFNSWAVWDKKTDTWSKPEECNRRYAFGHCQAGEEVYVFGGAESSAFGWIKRDGAIFSFKDNRWRPMPMDNGPHGRRDFSMCWTGKMILVWGGNNHAGDVVEEREKGAANVPWNTVMAFNPTTKKWQAMPNDTAPKARSDCVTIWTGKEMIVWGGHTPFESGFYSDGYAYNPRLNRWRKLPELPKKN
jgi:hypothetical protein